MVDAGEFRDGQRKQWNVAADGWIKWSEPVERAVHVVSERLIEMAGVQPGFRVLDVACGYGEPALTAAKVAGPEGTVVATDISAQMIAHARERAAEAGVDNLEFEETPAESLDFPNESFDAAVSRWGIIFEPDGEGVAAKVRGFLKPERRFAISSWGQPDQVPFLAIPMRTVMQRLDVPPPPSGTPGPLSRPTPDALSGLLEAGGFTDVDVDDLAVTLEWESPEDFTTYVREIAPPISALMAGHPPDVQEGTWAAITEAVRDAAGGDGPVSFTNAVLLAAGRA